MRELRHAAAQFAEGAGFSGARLDDVRACVSEAVTNVVVHAFAGARATGTVTVTAELDADELLLRVSDDGAGFRPRTDSPGLGLGSRRSPRWRTPCRWACRTPAARELCMAFARERAPEPAIHG